MNNRGLLALLILFFAGLIGLWSADHFGVLDRTERMSAEPRVLPELVKLRPDGLERIEIEGQGTSIVCERRPGNRWQLLRPIDTAADPRLVENLAFNLKGLLKSKDVGSLEGAPADYGFTTASPTIRLFGSDRSKPLATLEVGASIRDKRYVRRGGFTAIEVVDAKALAAVDAPVSRWRDRTLIRVPTFQVEGLTVDGPGRSLDVQRDGSLWRIRTPYRAIADTERVENAIAELTSLSVLAGDAGFVADDATDLAPFGLDRPSATIRVRVKGKDEGAQSIHLGKPAPADPATGGERSYARRDDQNDVVLIDARRIKDLGVNPLELHGKKVADIVPNRTDFIRLTSEGATTAVARFEGRGWVRVAPLLDQADPKLIDDLIKRLDELQAAEVLDPKRVVDPQLDKPWAVLEVWQDARLADPSQSRVPKEPARFVIRLGRRDLLNKVVFAQVDGDQAVLALPTVFLEGLPRGSLAFRDRQVASTIPAEIERIEIRQGATGYTIVGPPKGAAPTSWRLTAPIDAPADPQSIAGLLSLLANLRADRLVTDQPKSDAEFGLDAPVRTVVWVGRTEPVSPPLRPVDPPTVTLTIGGVSKSNAGARFARISTSPIVFTLAPEVLTTFEAEWRDRTVLPYSIGEFERIKLTWPGRSVAFRPVSGSGNDTPEWTLDGAGLGPNLGPQKIPPLASALAKLTTFRFRQYTGPIGPETGLIEPRFTVEIGLSQGRPPIRLKLGRRTPDGYLYATTEPGSTGAVFLLPLGAWEPVISLVGKAEQPAPPK